MELNNEADRTLVIPPGESVRITRSLLWVDRESEVKHIDVERFESDHERDLAGCDQCGGSPAPIPRMIDGERQFICQGCA